MYAVVQWQTHSVAREREAITPLWKKAHEKLERLADMKGEFDLEVGKWLLAARRAQTHRHLGYADFTEYAERLFGYPRRTVIEKLRVAEALEELPSTAEALRSNDLHWSAVRELTRVATSDTEEAWVGIAKGKTVRQLEPLVAARHHGQCRVPGCTNSTYLDVHHVHPKHESGLNNPANLILLCCAHHKAHHRGLLIIDGDDASNPDRLTFRHADGTVYGSKNISPDRISASADAFLALKELGFKDSVARQLIDDGRAQVGTDCSPEDLLRAALQRSRSTGG